VERLGPEADAAREAERAKRELAGCTFSPGTAGGVGGSGSPAAGGSSPAVYERLYRQAEEHEASLAAARGAADEGARALANAATHAEAREALLAAEAAQRRSKAGLQPTHSSLSLASAAAMASSLGLKSAPSRVRMSPSATGTAPPPALHATTNGTSGGGGAATGRRSPALYSPVAAVSNEASLTFDGDVTEPSGAGGGGGVAPDEAPIAVRSVAILSDGAAAGDGDAGGTAADADADAAAVAAIESAGFM